MTRKGDRGEPPGPFFSSVGHCVTIAVNLPDRFFLATVLGGRLHVQGVPDWGPWDSSRLEYFTESYIETESYIDPGLVGAAGDRKVRTLEELDAAIEEPMRVAPTRNVWIHESLEDKAGRLSDRIAMLP